MTLRITLLRAIALLALFALIVPSCKQDKPIENEVNINLVSNFDAEVPLKWHKVFLTVERYAAGYRPGPAPRALAYMGLAAYEACIPGMPDYNSLASRYPGLDVPQIDEDAEYHWPSVVHGVYRNMMSKFFSSGVNPSAQNYWAQIDNELNASLEAEAGTETFNRSMSYGMTVGEAFWSYSTTDPYGHDAYKDPFGNFTTNETYDWQARYTGPGDWVPTVPGPGKPMGPFFGRARAFAITEDEKLAWHPSKYFMEYSEDANSEWYSQALQVYTKNAELDYTTEWIGEFWSDDLLNLTFSPGPRWAAVANQVIELENANLETAIECYAKVGMALNDAAVGCWNSKFYYNIERPDSYIKRVIDPNYKTNLYNPITNEESVTPSFPAYPSGHSTMGAAGAEALASVFGYSYSMTDRCHEDRTEFEGVPRTFSSFEQMAEENAWSRVLLGVHWRMDCDEGVRFGKEIGQKVNSLPWKK